MNQQERALVEDKQSAKRMWRFWWAANACGAIAYLLSATDFMLVPAVVGLAFYFKVVSEMKRQLRLREIDTLLNRYGAWGVGGIYLPLFWPIWRRMHPLPKPEATADDHRRLA
jgi:hypothetical protein